MSFYFVLDGNKKTKHYNFQSLIDAPRDFHIDASYGNIVLPPLENDEYDLFIHDINAAILKGAFKISIFSDASGAVFVQDSNGNDINLRLVVSTSYTYPHVDENGVSIVGYYTMTFDDGSTFGNGDLNHNAYWYFIEDINDINSLKQLT